MTFRCHALSKNAPTTGGDYAIICVENSNDLAETKPSISAANAGRAETE